MVTEYDLLLHKATLLPLNVAQIESQDHSNADYALINRHVFHSIERHLILFRKRAV
jgi:hypothetical protein